MEDIVQAKPEDAAGLAALYGKAFASTGFKEFATLDKRDELIEFLKGVCAAGKIWIRCDSDGPIVLGHYEPEKNEIVIIATRNDMEQTGQATAMLKKLVAVYPSVGVRPVTRGGQSVAKKCEFSPSINDSDLWVQMRCDRGRNQDSRAGCF